MGVVLKMPLNTRLEESRTYAKPAPRWLKVAKKKKRYETANPEWHSDPTPAAFVIACVGGACGTYTALAVQDALTKSGTVTLPWLPPWRAHMAIACLGLTTYVVSLFFLEVLGRRSKHKAMKSSVPWLSLVFISAAATAVHIPIYPLIVLGAICCWWAYRRTRAIR